VQAESLLSAETLFVGHLRSPLERSGSDLPTQRDRSPLPSLNRGRRSRDILSGRRLAALLVPLFPTGRDEAAPVFEISACLQRSPSLWPGVSTDAPSRWHTDGRKRCFRGWGSGTPGGVRERSSPLHARAWSARPAFPGPPGVTRLVYSPMPSAPPFALRSARIRLRARLGARPEPAGGRPARRCRMRVGLHRSRPWQARLTA
jgi:hypothetical protein